MNLTLKDCIELDCEKCKELHVDCFTKTTKTMKIRHPKLFEVGKIYAKNYNRISVYEKTDKMVMNDVLNYESIIQYSEGKYLVSLINWIIFI